MGVGVSRELEDGNDVVEFNSPRLLIVPSVVRELCELCDLVATPSIRSFLGVINVQMRN